MVQTLLITVMLAWMPTVDGGRVNFGAYEVPYWLGVSIPPYEDVYVAAFQNNELLFVIGEGTDTFLYYVEKEDPILFYENGEYVGQLIPEPNSMILFSFGLYLLRSQRKNKWVTFLN